MFKDIQGTILINLDAPIENILNRIDKKARWGIRKAEKEGLSINEINNETDLNTFYEIYKETCKNGKILPENLDEIKKQDPIFFVCKKDDKVIAGAAIKKDLKNNKIILYLNCSLQDYMYCQPNNLLYWHIIKWGKNKNFKIFDLGGWQINARDNQIGINKFKERWGGKLIIYHIYSKNPFYIIGRKLIRNFDFFWWLNKRIKGRE